MQVPSFVTNNEHTVKSPSDFDKAVDNVPKTKFVNNENLILLRFWLICFDYELLHNVKLIC